MVENAKQATDTADVSVMTDEQLEKTLVEPAEQQTETTETKEEVKEEVKTEAAETPAKEPEVKVETVSIPVEEYERLKKQVTDKEQFIQRRNTEVGELRRQLREQQESLERKVSELDVVSDPLSVIKANQELSDLKSQDRELSAEQSQLNMAIQAESNKRAIVKVIPEFEALIEDIVAIANEDAKIAGADPYQMEQAIKAFRTNPYYQDPILLINLANRAKLKKDMTKLQEEVVKLKKKPEEVVRSIEKAFNEKPVITQGSGKATSTKIEVSPDQVSSLSDAELNELIKQG